MSICTPDWSALASQNEKLVDGRSALDWPRGDEASEHDAAARPGGGAGTGGAGTGTAATTANPIVTKL